MFLKWYVLQSRRATQIQVSVEEHNLMVADRKKTKLFEVNDIFMFPSNPMERPDSAALSSHFPILTNIYL